VTVRFITQALLPTDTGAKQQQPAGPAAAAGASAFARTLCDPPPRLPSGKPQPGGVSNFLFACAFVHVGPNTANIVVLWHTGGFLMTHGVPHRCCSPQRGGSAGGAEWASS
jgi:hypothetical protein